MDIAVILILLQKFFLLNRYLLYYRTLLFTKITNFYLLLARAKTRIKLTHFQIVLHSCFLELSQSFTKTVFWLNRLTRALNISGTTRWILIKCLVNIINHLSYYFVKIRVAPDTELPDIRLSDFRPIFFSINFYYQQNYLTFLIAISLLYSTKRLFVFCF